MIEKGVGGLRWRGVSHLHLMHRERQDQFPGRIRQIWDRQKVGRVQAIHDNSLYKIDIKNVVRHARTVGTYGSGV